MSLKNLEEAKEKGKLICGVKQVLKAAKGKKKLKVFVAKDVRDETIKKLEDSKIEFEVLKGKEEIAKALDLNFESEVFMIR